MALATVVDWGMVGGTVVGGLTIVLVGGASVVSGGGSVVAVVVATGGDVWGGDVWGGDVALVPVLRGCVVTTGGWVVPAFPAGADVVLVSAGADVDGDEVEVGMTIVFNGRCVVVGPSVVEGACVATCCFGDESLPVATSNRRAANATDARA